MNIGELLAKDKALMQAWDMLAEGLNPQGIAVLNSALIISYSIGGLDVCRDPIAKIDEHEWQDLSTTLRNLGNSR